MTHLRKGSYIQTRPWTNGKDPIKLERLIRAEFDALPKEDQELLQVFFDMDKAWLPAGIGLYGWLELRAAIQHKAELDGLADRCNREGKR